MRCRKCKIVWITALYFCICWMLYSWNTPAYISSETVRIYSIHGMTEGYYSICAFLVLYTAALICYVLMMMREDWMYIVIRYLDRKELWKIKIYHMIKYIFEFTFIHFIVDIVLLLFSYPVSSVLHSQVLTYLLLFFPNAFFYYIFFISVFLMWQTMFPTWKAIIVTSGMAVLIYLIMYSGNIPAWNPFFFLSLLSMQMRNGVNEADLILSYMNILSMDVIVVFMGLKYYHEKEYRH